jgi:phage gp16-like protein
VKMSAAPDIRKRELAQIHIAKQQLGIEDDTYRAMLWTVARVHSAGDLDFAGRKKVLDHLKARGFKVKPSKNAMTSRPLASDDQSKKIRALWLELHGAGAVRDPSEKALAAYVKRMTKVSALQWLDGSKASTVIESLKAWLERL